MKNRHNATVWVASAVLLSVAAGTAGAQELVRPTLSAAQCQPLSPDNADLCCVAMNRDLLLTAAQIHQCPPLTTARLRAALEKLDPEATGSVQPGVVPGEEPGEQPGEEPGEEPAINAAKANSGAGNAGETGSGEHSSSDADPGNSGGNNNSPDSPAGQN